MCSNVTPMTDFAIQTMSETWFLLNESFSLTGNTMSGERLDFVLDNVNKKVKSILVSGVPNADDWMLAFHNYMYHELENIRNATHSKKGLSGLSSGSSKVRTYDKDNDIS